MNRKGERGISIAFAAISAVLVGILVLGISKLFHDTSREMNYMMIMDHVRSLAETGLNEGISNLTIDPSSCDPTGPSWATFTAVQSVPIDEGGYHLKRWYQNVCFNRNIPQKPNVYYVVTIASVEVNGQMYSQDMGSYFEISNVGSYFAAINGGLSIAMPSNIANGKVYAKTLNFDYPGLAGDTIVLSRAEFWSSLAPAFNEPSGTPTEWDATVKSKIIIADTYNNNSPIKLTNPLTFPLITPSDLNRYRGLATLVGNHTTRSNFSGELYPPGFSNFNPVSPPALDPYPAANHTTDNREHVYYSAADIRIGAQGTTTHCHGQILFVSEGDIYIDGNLRSAVGALPGGLDANASTAHQCVLIPGPGRNVIISNNFYVGPTPTVETEFVEALIFAPSGIFAAQSYAANPNIHDYLRLQFTGSMILGGSPDMAVVFNNGATPRIYQYMATLLSNPPPYLPALLIVYNQFDRVTGRKGIY